MIRLCQALEISAFGDYAWRKRKPSQRKREDEALGKLIEDAYQNNRQVYGSPRVHAELKELGVHCGRKRVARLMRERGINAKPKRRKMKTTDSVHSNPVAPNVLARDFAADAPNTKWIADITDIETKEGDLYLAAVVDIYSRFAVGWANSLERYEQLITKAAVMALERRHPEAGLLHHSDRGSQYTSHVYQALLKQYGIEISMSEAPPGGTHAPPGLLLKQYGIEISMSGKGDCYDNTLMESFFGTVKEECVERQSYKIRAEAKTSVFEYLEVFYNRQRRHSSLGYVSPSIYEKMKGEAELQMT